MRNNEIKDLENLLKKGEDFHSKYFKPLKKREKTRKILIREELRDLINDKKIRETTKVCFIPVEETMVEKRTSLFKNIKNHKENYSKILVNLENIEIFLNTSSDQESEMYLKLIEQYRDSIKKTNEKLNLNKIDEEEYSEDVTYKFSYVIERDFLRILTSVTKGEKLKNKQFYRELKKYLEEYLENIGFYKRNDLKIIENEMLNENGYTYMELFRVNTEDKNLDKKIKEIDLDPYFIKFYDNDGEEKEYATKGKLSVYILKEKGRN